MGCLSHGVVSTRTASCIARVLKILQAYAILDVSLLYCSSTLSADNTRLPKSSRLEL